MTLHLPLMPSIIHQDKPQLHLLAMPHTELNINCSWCAFSMLARNMATMMTRQGYRVILYAGSETDAEYTENIVCHPKPDNYDFFVPPWTFEYFKPMSDRIIEEMRKRIKPGDIILKSTSLQNPVSDQFPKNISVEYAIGYGGCNSACRVFPSEAWRHEIYGRDAAARGEDIHTVSGWATDCVIPHMIDVAQFPAGKGGDYLLFMGRMGAMKGEDVAVATSQATGIPLKLAGPGTPPNYGEYLGVVKPEERAELMGNALAFMCPSIFPEPFGMVAIEAQAVGTPVLCTPWGAFCETVEDNITGYRCYTIDEFADAALKVKRLNRGKIRQRATQLYSFDAIGPQYTRYFERMLKIFPQMPR